MAIDKIKYSKFLEEVAQTIDIPPSKYQQAVDRYQSVGQWLESGEYQDCVGEPGIYPQGSFRLGTVVRPIRAGVEADYDIDLVCELPIARYLANPREIKMMVGERLQDHETYRRLLDDEGKRCWTLEYAEQDGVGFHVDILPSVPERREHDDTGIAITNKQGTVYCWSASDPQGYGIWFDDRNDTAFARVAMEQKRSITARASHVYASVDDVPDQLVRTPLQRVIQIMKRHRDVKFSNDDANDFSPISMIITTLSARLYQGEIDVYTALTEIVTKLHAYTVLIDEGAANRIHPLSALIRRTSDGRWNIGNPVNPDENFADRWHEDDHARARAFFSWVVALKSDLVDFVTESRPHAARTRLSKALGASAVSDHVHLIESEEAVVRAPRIQIGEAAKPWKS